MHRLELRLFGPPQIFQDVALIHIERRKALALFVYLAATGQPQSRETLSVLLWPEETPELAHADLRRMLSLLRRKLGAEILESDREIIWISPDAEIDLDIAQFRSYLNSWHSHSHPLDEICLECLESVSAAVLIYRDDFLSGYSLTDAPEYDAWQRFQSQALENELAAALDWLGEQYARLGRWGQAISSAQRRLALDSLDEPAQVRLMQYYAGAGQYSAVRRQYKECERVLKEELGVSPQAETRRAYQALLEQHQFTLPEKAATLNAPSLKATPRHNLPVQRFPFIGREDLLSDLVRYLDDPHCRLLTLIGPGGSGKTRLALEAATRQISAFPQGIFLISLASVASFEMIPQTIAQVIGLTFARDFRGKAPDHTVQMRQLMSYLREQELLLILDGFEHILPGARLVSELLQAAPKLKVLATSRARLDLVEEQLYPLGGMSLPHWGAPRAGAGNVEEASTYGAIRLFIAVARRTRPEFTLTNQNLAAVLRICRAVAGLPLGIMLAAPWLRMLSPQEVAIQIDRDYSFLETGSGDLPEGQRSLHAVFTHSWKLLSRREQEVFRGLSVIEGGFTAQAAQAITGASLHELSSLYDQSLVQRESEGRYTLHELIKQFAAEQLMNDPQAKEAVRKRHCMYYMEFLEQWQARLQDQDQGIILASILPEIGNLRAGWDWANEQADTEDIEKIAELQLRIGDLARQLYDHEVAADAYRRVMKRFSDQGKLDKAARVAMKLGLAYQIADDPNQARQAYDQGFSLWQQASQSTSVDFIPPAPHALRVAVWDSPYDRELYLTPHNPSPSLSGVAVTQLFSRLVISSPELEVLPDVARSWEISEGGRRYLFHLNEHVFWSDGTPVTASDFEFAWKWILAPANRFVGASLLFDIRGAQAYHQGKLSDASQVGIQALDAHTLLVNLEQPACYFLYILAHPITNPIPRHLVLTHGSEWISPGCIVTNGPFRLSGHQTDLSLKLRRNPSYHGSFSGNLQEIELFFFDTSASLAAYESDQLDFIKLNPFFQPSQIRQKHLGEFLTFPELTTRFLIFDPTRAPFDDARVRQALSLSFNREELAERVMEGATLPAPGSFVPPGMPGHFDNVALAYNPEKARQLLAAAGYRGGNGFPSVTVHATSILMDVAAYLQNQWRHELGIDLSIRLLTNQNVINPSWIDHEEIPAIRMFAWSADYPDPDNFLRVFMYHNWKEFSWQNPTYFDLVNRARRTHAQEERMSIYFQAEKMLAEEAVIVPLCYTRARILLKPWVRRFQISPMIDDYWKDVVIEPHE